MLAVPQSGVVYVDNDPAVLSHARALLTSGHDGATGYLDADASDVGKILTRVQAVARAQRVTPRSREQVTRFFDGLDLIEPGVVPIQQWRPDSDAEATARAGMWGGVETKP